MDREYVTRREWELHLRDADRRDKIIDLLDTKMDHLQTSMARFIGGIGAVVILVQLGTTIFLSQAGR